MYNQASYRIDEGFLGVIPLIIVLAINDLIAILFYLRIYKPKDAAKFIGYPIFIFISIVLILLFIATLLL